MSAKGTFGAKLLRLRCNIPGKMDELSSGTRTSFKNLFRWWLMMILTIMFMPRRRIKPAKATSPEHPSSTSLNLAQTDRETEEVMSIYVSSLRHIIQALLGWSSHFPLWNINIAAAWLVFNSQCWRLWPKPELIFTYLHCAERTKRNRCYKTPIKQAGLSLACQDEQMYHSDSCLKVLRNMAESGSEAFL